MCKQAVEKECGLGTVSAAVLGVVEDLAVFAIFWGGTERALYGKAAGNNRKRILRLMRSFNRGNFARELNR